MAKADFCFNFYDGDATRDMAHMNRLERGAYMDVMIQQRQRGHLSLEDLKRFLSKDFDAVWTALEWVMKKDGDGKFFIEWIEVSEARAKTHSKLQKERRSGKSGSTEIKSGQSKKESGQPPVDLKGNGNGNGNEDGNETVVEIGKKAATSISIRAKYAGESARRIYDLSEYYKRQGTLGELTLVGWDKQFTAFMRANPGRVFDDDNHLYNTLKNFKNGKINGTDRQTGELKGAAPIGGYGKPTVG